MSPPTHNLCSLQVFRPWDLQFYIPVDPQSKYNLPEIKNCHSGCQCDVGNFGVEKAFVKSFTLHIMSSRSSSADVLEKIRKSNEDAESTSCHPKALVADRTDRQWKCQLGRQVVEAPLLCKQTRSTLKNW